MKKKEVQVGAVYKMRVGDRIADVEVTARHDRNVRRAGGWANVTTWTGRTLDTKREVTIRSAAKLRALVRAAPAS